MRTLLAVDIGNTNITLGVFCGRRLTKKIKMPTYGYHLHKKNLKNIFNMPVLKKEGPPSVIISSVVPLALSRFVMELNKIAKCRIAIIGRDVMVPIANRYRRKREVGSDRLVSAYAAKCLYGAPCVIIDFGTAITFDVVSRKGEYLGGLILPGIELSFSSLYDKTALLPKVELKPAPCIIGKDTVSSMRGGILFGFGAMCDGLGARYRKILGPATKVIATGGNASLIKRYAKSIQIVDEDLTLKGLRLIVEKS